MFGRNVNGDGDESDKSSATKVGECSLPATVICKHFSRSAPHHDGSALRPPRLNPQLVVQLIQTTRSALAPTAPADLSNAPAIIGAAGFNERVELKVLRPDTLASVAALSYKVWR